MGKNTKKKNKKNLHQPNRQSLENIQSSRTGGQIAIRGFNYQILFSCYSVLKNLLSPEDTIAIEGIEDIDRYQYCYKTGNTVVHTQLKYSTQKFDASSFNDILVNFLEVYLISEQKNDCFFELIYDLKIARGNLFKLITNNLDEETKNFWMGKIKIIKNEKTDWDWSEFHFDNFLKQLRFKNIKKNDLEEKINSLVIERESLATGNEQLFLNALFYNVYHAAEVKGIFNRYIVDCIFQEIKDNISKGVVNPAYQWIEKINFDSIKLDKATIDEYYRGRKATVNDIISNLPVRREEIEKNIIESVRENSVTVIKASSGQGKTTLAWQVASELRSEYTVYQVRWCGDREELANIVEYFNARLKVGEKILVIIDNLDADLSEWNELAQIMSQKLKFNYTILLTTREEDWFLYAGDQSNIGRLKIIDIALLKEHAQNIYEKLKVNNNLHPDCQNWQSAWEKIKDKKLLIEYIYLLTQGEMLEQRLKYQLHKVSQNKDSKLLRNILRLITFADLVDVKLTLKHVVQYFKEDISYLLQSLEKEYLIKVSSEEKTIEGLHPVRSKHISDFLHEFYPVEETAKAVADLISSDSVERVYSKLPSLVGHEKKSFYIELANLDAAKEYVYLLGAIKGLFWGSVIHYFNTNRDYFDIANERGGLFLFANEINPWNDEKYGAEIKSINEMLSIFPENENYLALSELAEKITRFDVSKSILFSYTENIYSYLSTEVLKTHGPSLFPLTRWLLRINDKFNLISIVSVSEVWIKKDTIDVEEIALFFYELYNNNIEIYNHFLKDHKNEILSFLRVITDSVEIFEKAKDIHIHYLLLPQDIDKANEESVKRIDLVCKFLPYYEHYSTKSITPKIDSLSILNNHDFSIKNMPYRNVSLSFNSDLSVIWGDTILSNYEMDSVYDYQRWLISSRKKILEFFQLHNKVLIKRLQFQPASKAEINCFEEIVSQIDKLHSVDCYYPNEKKEHGNRLSADLKNTLIDLRSVYLEKVYLYVQQFMNIINKNSENSMSRIALGNLLEFYENLPQFQKLFDQICSLTDRYFETSELDSNEKATLHKTVVLVKYYLNNEPSMYFSYNMSESWVLSQKRNFIEKIHSCIDEMVEQSSLTFLKPSSIHSSILLTTVPIGIYDYNPLDLEQNEILEEILLFLADIDVTFILLIPLTANNVIETFGIRMHIDYLRRYSTPTEYVPLPFIITPEYLKCFSENIEIEKEEISESQLDSFLLELWKYSQLDKYYKECTDNEKDFLYSKLIEIKNNLDFDYNITDFSLPESVEKELYMLKLKVIKDHFDFNEKLLNEWINWLIQYKLEEKW